MDPITRLWRRVLLLVGRGRTHVVDDGGNVQRLQVQLGADETKDAIPRVAEYGFQSNPPAGSDAVVLFVAGERTNGVVIATGNQTYRMTGLASGEVALSDNRGQRVYLSAAGIRIEGNNLPIVVHTNADATVNSANATVNASSNLKLNASGDIDLTAGGAFNVSAANFNISASTAFTGQVSANGHRIDETHAHSGVLSGGANTGPVT